MRIALDSNVIIAALSRAEAHSALAERLMREVASGTHTAIASSLVYGEVLGVSTAAGELDLPAFFAALQNLATVPADDELCRMAGELRGAQGGKLRLPDAIHLATALSQSADVFVTDDTALARAAKALIPTTSLTDWPSLSAD